MITLLYVAPYTDVSVDIHLSAILTLPKIPSEMLSILCFKILSGTTGCRYIVFFLVIARTIALYTLSSLCIIL